MEQKRLHLFAGHYGSGKTNIAVNYALHLAWEGKPVCIADLDIVNPYFRTADSALALSDAGIRLVTSQFTNSNVDLPALPPEAYALVMDRSLHGIMDIGGDDRGAYALGRYAPFIRAENNYCMSFVVNCYRPLTATVEDALDVMREIETACGIAFTAIINNSNLGDQTTEETVMDSLEFVQQLSRQSGLPVWMHSVVSDLVPRLSAQVQPLFPLQLQPKYFDLIKMD